jgi:hypothetical protein
MVESSPEAKPIIAAFVSEMMTTTRIKSAAQSQGFELQVIDSGFSEENENFSPLEGEPTSGPDAAIFEKITRWNPALIIIDLGDKNIPWRHWLKRLKSSPAARRFPVLCFGPHVDKVTLAEAKELTADYVLPRSKFFRYLPSVIDDSVRDDDTEAIASTCSEPLALDAAAGINAFNQGHYFEAHEHLEDAWNADKTAGRNFYQALTQIAVVYLQVDRLNYRGAYKMLLRSRQWFHGLPDLCHGVDVKSIKVCSEEIFQELVRLGPERMTEFDVTILKPITYAKH